MAGKNPFAKIGDKDKMPMGKKEHDKMMDGTKKKAKKKKK